MAIDLLLTALAVVGLLALLYFTALADGALRSLNQVRVRNLLDQGVGRREVVERLLAQPFHVTATALVVNTLALVALAAITALEAADIPSASDTTQGFSGQRLAVAAAVALLGLVVILFFQLIPRAIAQNDPERTAIRIGGALDLLSTLAGPASWAMQRVATGMVRLFGVKGSPRNPFFSEEDFTRFVTSNEHEDAIEEDERQMFARLLRFGDGAVHEVMVPRPDVIAVGDDLAPAQALQIALGAGHSRLPVYKETIDTIVGVVYTRDLIDAVMGPRKRPLAEIVRPPIVVPETKNLGELLHELQASRVHMAIVADEYGGTAGIATIEDLLEQIVGPIRDEYDFEPPDIEPVGPEEWVVLARIDLDEVNDRLGLALNSEDYDTLGGFITAELDRLPEEGDEIEVQGVRMRVLDTEGRRTGRVRITRARHDDGPEEPAS